MSELEDGEETEEEFSFPPPHMESPVFTLVYRRGNQTRHGWGSRGRGGSRAQQRVVTGRSHWKRGGGEEIQLGLALLPSLVSRRCLPEGKPCQKQRAGMGTWFGKGSLHGHRAGRAEELEWCAHHWSPCFPSAHPLPAPTVARARGLQEGPPHLLGRRGQESRGCN